MASVVSTDESAQWMQWKKLGKFRGAVHPDELKIRSLVDNC